MQIRLEQQQNPVADEVSALCSVVRPILAGVLFALKGDVVEEAGGRTGVKLKMLPRLRRPGDGDCGICFEYAVHDGMRLGNPMVSERIADALKLCRITPDNPASILFAAEKSGREELIDTSKDVLTDNSQLLYGTAGRPVKLKKQLDALARAFRKAKAGGGSMPTKDSLPQSISGLWKADLFLGDRRQDDWVGTSVKINPADLKPEKGLRVGIVPARSGKKDKVYKDDAKNMVICPLAHDGSFMEVFYEGWDVVMQFLHADAAVPKEAMLPNPAKRQVARYLAERRDYAVADVIEALLPLAQPNLLVTTERTADLLDRHAGTGATATAMTTTTLIAPQPRQTTEA